MGAPLVLVVEDEPLVREIACEALSDAGFEVIEAADADAAISLLLVEADRVVALFTDLDLGSGADGVALAWEARKALPDLAVVYASGRPGGPREEERVPGARFLPKPYSLASAAATVWDLVGMAAERAPLTQGALLSA